MKEKGKALHLKALVLTLVAALLIFIPVMAVPQNAEAATKTISSGEMIQTSSGGVSATKNTTNSTVAVTITPKYYQSEARAQLAVLNKWRASNPGYKNQNEKWVYNGAQKALKYDYTLEKYAMQRAAEIAISMDHLRPNGTKRSGLTGYRGIGENIAATTYAAGGTKEYAFEMFEEKNKPYDGQGHRRIMISEPADFDAVGIACVYYNGSYYWAQIFGETTKPDTNPTEAVNGNKTMTVEVNPSLIKSKTADISKLSDMKMDMHKLSQDYLPEIPLSLGFNSTWPYATVNVIAKPTWTSGNTNIATVDSSKGTIKAVMNGSTNLTVKEPITGTSKTIKLTVTDSNPVTGVKLNKSSLSLGAGRSEKLTATLTPANAKIKKVTWSSSNGKVATVASDGTVKAVGAGTATITVKSASGKTATCKVTVAVTPTSVKLSKTATTLSIGSTEKLTATIAPTDATNKTINWSSSNSSVATVDKNGTVKALKAGEVTITAKTALGGKTATCKIRILSNTDTGAMYLTLNDKADWYYVEKGKINPAYTGFGSNEHGDWYFEKGKITFNKNSVIEGTVKGVKAWWNVKGSKVVYNETIENNENGWWYVKNGKVDFSYTGVKNNQNGWWYVKNGKVDFGYNGFAKNEHGWWYCEKGKVTFNHNAVTYGTVNGKTGWWNVRGSNVKFDTTVANNENGWWYCKNGMVDFSYTGFAKNENGWWYCEKGQVTFKYNGKVKGTINGKSATYTVKGSQVIL